MLNHLFVNLCVCVYFCIICENIENEIVLSNGAITEASCMHVFVFTWVIMYFCAGLEVFCYLMLGHVCMWASFPQRSDSLKLSLLQAAVLLLHIHSNKMLALTVALIYFLGHIN